MATFDSDICPRCGEPMPLGEADHATACIYEPCTEVSCKALRNPLTFDQMTDAQLHFRYHKIVIPRRRP